MAENCICLLGSDERMEKLAQLMYNAGYEVYRDINMAEDGDILIMPPNMFELPDCEAKFEKIYGGKVKNAGDNFINYAGTQSFKDMNGVLTAKGIVDKVIEDIHELAGRCILVTGYGSCGRAITEELKSKMSNIDVMVRRKELRRQLRERGLGYIDIYNAPEGELVKYDIVINTIPAPVIDSTIIDMLNDKVIIYDIASAPGGVDYKYCELRGIKAGIYLGIPGRMYPQEAAQVMYDTIISYLA